MNRDVPAAFLGIVVGAVLTALGFVAMTKPPCDEAITALRQANDTSLACIADSQALLADVIEQRAWIDEVTRAAAEFINSEDQDQQTAYDLLWCIAGQAPIADCMSLLGGVGGPVQPTPMPVPLMPVAPGKEL